MIEADLWAVLAATVSAFVLGGLWYGLIFAKAWQVQAGITDEQLASQNQVKIFSIAFLLALIAAFIFGEFLGPKPDFSFAVGAGVSAGLAWVAATLGIIYLFEQRPLGHWLINGGYATLQFALFGLIFGLMG
ncbi:DUF1761 domain-containing protein [Erythrobacter rubeus]|uniref:DUF1761 domain-containing protein n=1 Tax=Erythrobacter rubeus TaxID=2760803 RepID=A0ABR8KPG8_9SPHN|nr:DUF1761 domain-containing protein [Erythrobacter rubeus]MBD2842597.1 DUF1761 domain-containing protein [Erythrobacter rubeus]